MLDDLKVRNKGVITIWFKYRKIFSQVKTNQYFAIEYRDQTWFSMH